MDPVQIKTAIALKDVIKGISKDISDEFKNYFEAGLSEYIEDRYKKLSITNSFIFSDKVDFYSIYFPLTLKGNKQAFKSDIVTECLFSDTNTSAVLGVAGSGKSMLMRHIFLSYYKTWEKIPIFIELRDFNNHNLSFEDYILSIILKNRIKPNLKIIEKALKTGKFIFLFDGFDEISLLIKTRLTQEFEQFIDSYPENNYIFSSRPGTGIETFPRLRVFNVQPLSRSEIDEFIDIQIKQEEDAELKRKLKETISKQENRSFLSYVANPLLLSMFILTYRNYPELPRSKNKFYWNVFDTLCTRHDSLSKKGGFYHEKKTKILSEDFEKILKAFCYITLLEDKYSFDNQYLVERLRLVRDKLGYGFDIEDLIYDLAVSISILSKDGLEYKFPHRSLQDYFTALFIKSQSDFSKKRIYAEKLERVKIFGFINHRDLFDLLIELDKESFYEYCIIPLVNEFTLRFPKSEIDNSALKLMKFLEIAITVKEEESFYVISDAGRRVFSFIEIGTNYGIDLRLESKKISKETALASHIEQLKLDGNLVPHPNEKSTFTSDRKIPVLNYELIVPFYTEKLKDYIEKMTSLEEKLNRELSDEKSKKISIWDF